MCVSSLVGSTIPYFRVLFLLAPRRYCTSLHENEAANDEDVLSPTRCPNLRRMVSSLATARKVFLRPFVDLSHESQKECLKMFPVNT